MEKTIKTRPENLNSNAKSKMLLSYRTHQVFKITCYSTVVVNFNYNHKKELNMCFRNNFDMVHSRNTWETTADQKSQMPRNLVIMIARLEFKETLSTLRVIHANDSTGKVHGAMLQIIKFQKSNGIKYKHNNSITKFAWLFIYFLSTSGILLLLLYCYILVL